MSTLIRAATLVRMGANMSSVLDIFPLFLCFNLVTRLTGKCADFFKGSGS